MNSSENFSLKLNKKILAGFAFMSAGFWIAVFMDTPLNELVATVVFLGGTIMACCGVVDLEMGD